MPRSVASVEERVEEEEEKEEEALLLSCEHLTAISLRPQKQRWLIETGQGGQGPSTFL
jgi:hypothetical protein